MMTQPWHQVVARYEDYKSEQRSIRALGTLAWQISQSPLAEGLFAWTSMFDLCIVQTPVSYPYDGPLIRISPIEKERIEFRYFDTRIEASQWHRTVDADQVFPRLIKFLDQLRWFPAEFLERISPPTR